MNLKRNFIVGIIIFVTGVLMGAIEGVLQIKRKKANVC